MLGVAGLVLDLLQVSADHAWPVNHLPVRPRASSEGADIEVEPDGTVIIRVKPVNMSVDLMRGVLDARFSLGLRRAPVLVDTRRVLSMSREAQQLSAKPGVREYTACLALVVESALSVMLANMFIAFARPPYPTRMFRDEVAARGWLAQKVAAQTGNE